MTRRLVPAGLVIAAAFADRAGAHGLAFDAILVAVPVTAVAGLAAFAEQLERGTARVQALLWAMALLFVVVGAAARAPAVAEGVVPPLAVAALVGCLTVFCAQALFALAGEVRPLERQGVGSALGDVD
jgi:cyanate permease